MAKTISSERRAPLAQPGASYALASQIFGKPLAMREDAAQLLVQAVARTDFDPKQGAPATAGLSFRDDGYDVAVSDEGVAVIKIAGPLLNRSWWFCSYEWIAEQCARLAKEKSVQAVVLDIDSGGGMIAGLWEACDAVRELAEQKQTVAVAADHAFSAAYALASCASKIYVSRAGGVGSVGVIQIHQSIERMIDAEGVDVTILQAGEHKSDGTHLKRLGIGAKAEMMAGIDDAMDDFVAHVARERGMDEDDVRAMEARAFEGRAAKEAGLVDGVKSLRTVLKDLKASLKSGDGPKRGARGASDADAERVDEKSAATLTETTETPMTTKTQAAVEAGDDQIDAATAATQAADAAKVAERDRIRAITTGDAAKAAPALADHLAYETSMDAEAAQALLAAAGQDVQAATEVVTVTKEEVADDAPEGDDDDQKAAASAKAGRRLDNALDKRMRDPRNSARVAPDLSGERGADAGDDAFDRHLAQKGQRRPTALEKLRAN